MSSTKRICQALELRNDPALIEEYKYWHRAENIWPEIPAGIKEVGILDMEIYILGQQLFMIVEVPGDFDWDKSFARLATLDRQTEWERFMAKFQLCDPDSGSSERWKKMEQIFKL
jgi:L-rhamnose mutarotase